MTYLEKKKKAMIQGKEETPSGYTVALTVYASPGAQNTETYIKINSAPSSADDWDASVIQSDYPPEYQAKNKSGSYITELTGVYSLYVWGLYSSVMIGGVTKGGPSFSDPGIFQITSAGEATIYSTYSD